MPMDEALADTGSLYTHSFWAAARTLAQKALHALELTDTPLVLRHVTYVK
jgi:hypothetical protein